MVDTIRRLVSPALKQAPPPHRRIKGPRATVERRVDVAEEIPDMADDDTHNLVLGYSAVEDQAETHKNPRQVWRGEDQQAEEREPRVRVAAGPDVDESRGERVAQEGHRNERRQADQTGRGVQKQPGEVRGRSTG